MKTEHSIDWRKTAAEIQADYEAVCQQRDEHRDGRLAALEKLAITEKQRDELLAALQECMAEVDEYETRTGKALAGEWPAKARKAIASVKGETK